MVGTASSYPPERAREWLVAQSVVPNACTDLPRVRARFAPRALAELEQRSNREACRAFGPAMIFDEFVGDDSDIGSRPGCCEWHRCDLAALLGKGSVNGLTIEQVEWHGDDLRGALHCEFPAEGSSSRHGHTQMAAEADNSAAGATRHNVRPRLTINAERDCKDWLFKRMTVNKTSPERKPDVELEALERFPGLSQNAFNRAWANAVEIADASMWSRAGRKPRI
jgi:hypothetical protein